MDSFAESSRRSTSALLSDDPAIAISSVSDNRFCLYHHTPTCKRALDLLLVSRAGGESNHATTRGQYALDAQTAAGRAIVTIETSLSGSANAYQMCSRSHQSPNSFVSDTNALAGRRRRTARLAGRLLPVRPVALIENIGILILDTKAAPAMLPSSTACLRMGKLMMEL